MPTISVRGVEWAYAVDRPEGAPTVKARAEAPALILLHGFPLDGRVWAEVAWLTGRRWTTVRPDFPGFGQSASAAFTIESLAADLHEFLRLLNVLPAVVAGLSMGGYVALALASQYPQDVAGLALVDTRAGADDAAAIRKRLEMIGLLHREGVAAVVEQMYPNLLAPIAYSARHVVTGRLRLIMLDTPALTIERACLAMKDRPDQRDLLTRLQMPVAVLVGAEDKITPPTSAAEMAEAIIGATITVISAAGHLAPLEQPDCVAEALDELMSRVTRSAN